MQHKVVALRGKSLTSITIISRLTIQGADGRVVPATTEMFERVFGVRYLNDLEFDSRVLSRKQYKRILRADREKYSRGVNGHRNIDESVAAMSEKYGPLMERNDVPALTIKWIDEEIGWGLFAAGQIGRGTFIGSYTGTVTESGMSEDEKGVYLFSYHYPEHELRNLCSGVNRCYLENLVIDASKAGNHTRFVNQASDGRQNVVRMGGAVPGTNIGSEYIFYNGHWNVIFVALDDIQPGDQLLIDYGEEYWDLLGLAARRLR